MAQHSPDFDTCSFRKGNLYGTILFALPMPSPDAAGSLMHLNETLGSARVELDEATNAEPLAARPGT